MSGELSHAANPATESGAWFSSTCSRIARHADTRTLLLAIFVLNVVVMLGYSPFKQLERGDSAIYDYIAQSILRGDMPYRDVIDPKTPGSMYLSAGAMAAGKLFGMWDVFAVRWLHILLMGLLGVVTYLTAVAYLHSRMAAVIACLFPLLREDTVVMMLGGTQPKLSMMLFGMLSLLFIAKDKPFWAGVCSLLSFLCWQPGLLFTGTAFLIFSRYLTSWRDLRALKVVAGAALPLVITVLYFHLRGALGAMVEWTLIFPYSVFAPHRERTILQAAEHMWKVSARLFEWDTAILALSIIGFVMFGIERVRARSNSLGWLKSTDLFRDAILFPPVVYLGFCLINMQGGPDLIPFFPFIGIFSGWFIVEVARLISRARSLESKPSAARVWVPRVAAAVLLILTLGRAATYRFEGWTVKRQDEVLKKAFGGLGPDDKIYVHGPAEILLLLNRRNLNPYISLDHGADDYIGSKRPGGFSAVIAEMESMAPKFVAVLRLRNIVHREELKEWIAEHYERMPVNGYEVYVRKQAETR